MVVSAGGVEVGAIGAAVIDDASPAVALYLAAATLADDSVDCQPLLLILRVASIPADFAA